MKQSRILQKLEGIPLMYITMIGTYYVQRILISNFHEMSQNLLRRV